jgi:hypothetical protein
MPEDQRPAACDAIDVPIEGFDPAPSGETIDSFRLGTAITTVIGDGFTRIGRHVMGGAS